MLEEANKIVKEGSKTPAHIIKKKKKTSWFPNSLIIAKKMQLLGHIIRCDSEDPIRHIIFEKP